MLKLEWQKSVCLRNFKIGMTKLVCLRNVWQSEGKTKHNGTGYWKINPTDHQRIRKTLIFFIISHITALTDTLVWSLWKKHLCSNSEAIIRTNSVLKEACNITTSFVFYPLN